MIHDDHVFMALQTPRTTDDVTHPPTDLSPAPSPLQPRIRSPPIVPSSPLASSRHTSSCRSNSCSCARSPSTPSKSPSRTHCALSPARFLINENNKFRGKTRGRNAHEKEYEQPPQQEEEFRVQVDHRDVLSLTTTTKSARWTHDLHHQHNNHHSREYKHHHGIRTPDKSVIASENPRDAHWWWCVRLRRLLTFLPGLTKHHNSFVCDQMVRVALRTIVVFALLWISNSILLAHHHKYHQCASHPVDHMRFWIPVNAILALPALRYTYCQLFKHSSNDSHQFLRLKKTWLLQVCECFVMIEIPYLVVGLVRFFFMHHGFQRIHDQVICAWQDGTWLFSLVLCTQLLCVYAYFLRWWQLVVFHRLHEHLMYQRGYLHGKNRFCYDGKGFLERLTTRWTHRGRQIQEIKVRLYEAAKDGDLKRLEAAVVDARRMDGQDFAAKWYSPACDLKKVAHRLRVYGLCRRNPLHVATVFNRLDCVVFLIKNARFDVNGYDKLELFWMDVSAWYRRVFSFCFSFWFTKHTSASGGQTRSIFGSFGTLLTPLHVAVTLGHDDLAEVLVQNGADGDALAWSRHQRFCTPPLFWVVNDECADVLVLQADANLLYVPGNGYFVTAFEAARIAGNYGVANQLQRFGGDMALTPLHDAAARGDTKDVEFFLKRGADPDSLGENCVGYFRRSSLHWAAMRGHREVIRLLVKFGASVDLCDREGRTPLAWACYFGRLGCVEELLECGADPNRKDVDGFPILALCALSPAMASIHHDDGASQPTTVSSGIDSLRSNAIILEVFEKILIMWQTHGGDLAITCDKTGDTALHVALMKDHEEAAIAFVRHGMNLTMANSSGKRAIDFTKSTSIRYAVKKEAGYRDVMISYCHAHAHFAWKVRNALERAHITTWIDQMDPTGITGGAIWRQEIAHAIENSTMMLCILCEHYPESQWCMKELAYAKVTETPVLAIQCSEVDMNEEMQMYLYTRQIIDFKESILSTHSASGLTSGSDSNDSGQMNNWFQYNENSFDQQMKLLLDGIHAELQAQHEIPSSSSGNDKLETDPRHRLRHLATLRGESSRDLFTNNVVATEKDDEDTHERSLVRALTSYDLINLVHYADKNKDEKLQLFIAHGGLHDAFCQRLRKCLLASRCNVSVVMDVGTSMTCSKTRLVKCDAILVVLSPLTIQSSVVADQLAFAEDRLKMIVPVMLSTFEVDAAKRYTFSRRANKILHFNESLGFNESVSALLKTLHRLSEQKRQEIMDQISDLPQEAHPEELEVSDVDEYVDDDDDEVDESESDTGSVVLVSHSWKNLSGSQGHHQAQHSPSEQHG